MLHNLVPAPAAFGRNDMGFARGGRLGRFGLRAGRDQRDPRHTLRRTAQEFKRNHPAHPHPRQREFRRRPSQDLGGDFFHPFTLGRGGEHHRVILGQIQHLRPENPQIAQHRGDKDDRIMRHCGYLWLFLLGPFGLPAPASQVASAQDRCQRSARAITSVILSAIKARKASSENR